MDNVDVAKIVATPSLTAWSQVYNTGGLFTVISLKKEEKLETKNFLSLLGKDILSFLEKEFFSLEKKDLASIKQTILYASGKIPQDVIFSYVITAFVKNVMYAFILKSGRIDIKRDSHFGTILELKKDDPSEMISGSMLPQDGDLLLLQTDEFNQIIPSSSLIDFIDDQSPSQVSEILAPIIHKEQDALASAIVIRYHASSNDYKQEIDTKEADMENYNLEAQPDISDVTDKKEEEIFAKEDNNKPLIQATKNNFKIYDKVKRYKLALISKLVLFLNEKVRRKKFNHSQRLFLSIAAILIIVLALSLYLTIKQHAFSRYQTLFNNSYVPSYKEYQQALGLAGLNNNQATKKLLSAQKNTLSAVNKFPVKSSWREKTNSLLTKINNLLTKTSGIMHSKPTVVLSSLSPMLKEQLLSPNSLITYDGQKLYVLRQEGIIAKNINNSKQTLIIKNSNLRNAAVGFSVYYQNLYILTKNGQVIKYSSSNQGYSKTQYFSSSMPFPSAPVWLAIDGNVWILLKNGSIQKFSSGSYQNFNISGLIHPFSSTAKVFTDINTKNIYVLDPSNQRIVVLDKNGNYKSQYQTSILKDAVAFDPQEQENAIYFLAQGKIYRINLQ